VGQRDVRPFALPSLCTETALVDFEVVTINCSIFDVRKCTSRHRSWKAKGLPGHLGNWCWMEVTLELLAWRWLRPFPAWQRPASMRAGCSQGLPILELDFSHHCSNHLSNQWSTFPKQVQKRSNMIAHATRIDKGYASPQCFPLPNTNATSTTSR
jgi:hypothetical protein